MYKQNHYSIYLDHNATTPLYPDVVKSMEDMLKCNIPFNPSSVHRYGREGKKIMDAARTNLQQALGASNYSERRNLLVVICSSGTEANNLALRGGAWSHVMISALEHSSVAKSSVVDEIIPVDSYGIIDLEELEKRLSLASSIINEEQKYYSPKRDNLVPKRRENSSSNYLLLSVSLANSETGIIQPMREIAKIAAKYSVILHTDASQAFGKIPLNFEDLGVDMMTISGHKFGGPIGSAALVLRRGLNLKGIIEGGGQEEGLRSGTQNILAAHGFGVACSLINNINSAWSKTIPLRDKLEAEILKIADNEKILVRRSGSRLPNTVSLRIPGAKAHIQVAHFDGNGIAVSAGAACSAGVVGAPVIHLALGYGEEESGEFIRVSLGMESNEEEIKKFIAEWGKLFAKYNAKCYE